MRMPALLVGARVDLLQLMPDHVHGICIFERTRAASTSAEWIARFCEISTAELRRAALIDNHPFWDTYAHAARLRTRGQLWRARAYLRANPKSWEQRLRRDGNLEGSGRGRA